jgi:hypothetical protein
MWMKKTPNICKLASTAIALETLLAPDQDNTSVTKINETGSPST